MSNITASAIQQYTSIQRKRAEHARALHHKLSHPSDRVLGNLLDNNGIINCDLTSRDLRVASILYGPCEICRIGKATIPKKFGLVRESSSYPGQILHMDILFLPTLTKMTMFLICVCDNTGFILSYRLKSKTKTRVLSVMKKFISCYDNSGWLVQKIITDPEGVFISIQEDMSE